MATYGCEKRADGTYTYNGPCAGCGNLVVHDGRTDDVKGHQPCLSMWVDHDLVLDGVRVGTVRYGAYAGAVTWEYKCVACDPAGIPGSRVFKRVTQTTTTSEDSNPKVERGIVEVEGGKP